MATANLAAREFRQEWPALLAATIGVGIGISSLPFYSAGLFIVALRAEFDWTRGLAAGANTALTLGIALAAPAAGILIDRFGARAVAMVSMVFLAAGFCALSAMNGAAQVYLAIFFLMGVLGVGASPLSFTKVVNARFVHARGLALGICLMGTGLAGAVVPVLLAPLIAAQGWRAAYLALAGAVVAAIPLAWLLGDKATSTSAEAPRQDPRALSLLFADHRFWILLGASAAVAAATAGVVINLAPILAEKNVTAADAAPVASAVGLAVMAARLTTGAALDRWSARVIGGLVMSAGALGALLLHFGSGAMALPAAALVGIGLGAELDIISYLSARYFGLRAYGRAYGMIYGVTLLGAGLGPLIVGALADHAGGYDTALYVCAGWFLAGAILLFMLPRNGSCQS